MERFCPKCGKPAEVHVKNFCVNCFLEDNEVIEFKGPLSLEHCKKCNKIRVKGNWVEQEQETLKRFIASKVKVKRASLKELSVELLPLESAELVALVKARVEIEGQEIEVKRELLVKPIEVQCDDCSRLGGQYYEAILQLRFKGKVSREEISKAKLETLELLEAERKKHALSAVTDLRENRHGVDLLIGSNKAAKKVAEALAKKYHTKVISSYSVEGTNKDGHEKRRFTYCVKE